MEALLSECEVMKMMKSISCILLICIFGLVGYAEETQEQKVERLIKQLQDQNVDVRAFAIEALGDIGSEAQDAVPALIQLLQDKHEIKPLNSFRFHNYHRRINSNSSAGGVLD